MLRELKIGDKPEEWTPESWHLALAWYCSDKPSQPKSELKDILKKVAKELVKRENSITFHPETYTKCSQEIATEVFEEILEDGSYLVSPHGEMIWNGNKTAIVKSGKLKELYENFTFLCSGKRCYGMVRYKEPEEISLDEFDRLSKKHRISDAERDAWWPSKSKLYYYELRDFFAFKTPIRVNLPQGIQAYIKNIKQYFQSLEATEHDNEFEVLSLPTIPEALKGLEEIASDAHEVIAYSVAENADKAIVLDSPLKDISNIELLICHAEIHDKAEDATYEHGEASDSIKDAHSHIENEMRSRGMEHRIETTLDYDSPLLDSAPILRIKALGTRGDVEEHNDKHRKFTGIMLQVRGKKVLLDCGNKEFLEENPAMVILSHFHPDHFAWHDVPHREVPGVLDEDDFDDLMRTPVRAYGSTIFRHVMQYQHPECKVYVEPFCGSASVLFARQPVQTEVINDINDATIFQLRFIKSLDKKKMAYLKKQNWKPTIETWSRLRDILKAGKFKSDAHRFYILKYLSRYSWHWNGAKPGGPHVKESGEGFDPTTLERASDRLKKVKILKGDYAKIMKEYDGKDTFMFLDPPFHEHRKGEYANEGLDWDEYYRILANLKCKYIVLNSNSEGDKKEYRRLGIKYKILPFPGGLHVGVTKKAKYIFGANFELLRCKKPKTKRALLPAKIALDDGMEDDFDEYEEEIPETLFVAAPRSKCKVSKKAEKQGFNIEWTDKYEFDAFKFEAVPVKHSTVAPAVAWKIRVAGKTIWFGPDVLDFDKDALKGVDIYIGDGSHPTRDIVRKAKDDKGVKVGHMSVKNQLARVKEAGIKEAYIIHCGKTIIENPELDDSFEEQIDEWGAKVLSDDETIQKRVKLVRLDEVLDLLPDQFSTIDKYHLVGSVPVRGRGVDVDIVERGEVDGAARHRIHQVLSPIMERISFHNDSRGPMGSYIPLYRRTYTRIKTGYIPMSEDSSGDSSFLDLALEGKPLKEAQVSKREDKIVPGRFFALQKTHAGYHKREAFEPKEALEMLHPDKFPYIGEEKIDGMHIEVHWDGTKVILYSEDGREQRLEQVPEIVEVIKEFKPFIGVAEIDAWIPKAQAVKANLVPENRPAREGLVHLGRGDVTGYMHSKTHNPLIAKNMRLRVYDLLWTSDDKELFKKEQIERNKVRDSHLLRNKMVQAIDSTILKDEKAVVAFWKKIIKLASAEGIMLKPTKDRYVLWHSGGYWVKLKTLYELSAKVLKVNKVEKQPGISNATCAITEGGKLIYAGKTFNTKLPLRPGQVIEVRFQNISRYTDPKTGKKWYNWFRPTIIDIRKDKKSPDSAEIAERLVRATDGEVGEKPLPRIAKEALGILEFGDLTQGELLSYMGDMSVGLTLDVEDLVEVAVEPPMPKEWEAKIKKWSGISRDKLAKIDPRELPEHFFVLESHYRGKTNHGDLRVKENDSLEGRTLLTQVAGTITEPVLTLDQASEWSKKFHGPNASKYLKMYPGMPSHKGFMVAEKEKQPLMWATFVKTVVQPGEIGATKQYPGVFWGEDWGLAFKTVDKPWFSEWWIYGSWFKQAKFVDRMLPTTKKTEKAGKMPTYWRGHIAAPNSPPYIFSPSFFKNTEWVPEDSALPPNWEAAVPEKLRWWGKGLPKGKRLDLIRATFNYFVEEKYLKGRKKVLDEANFAITLKLDRRPYVIQRVWWRGPAHVRALAISVWYLRIGGKGKGLLTFKFEADPTRESQKGFAALRSISNTKPPNGKEPVDWFKFEGDLPPSHPENPTKKLAAHVTKVDSGFINLVADSADFLSGNFDGTKHGLNGYYIFKKESPESDIWLFKHSVEGEHNERDRESVANSA